MLPKANDTDRLKALAWLLRYAGIDTRELMKRFTTRVRVQKLVYLLRDIVPEFRGYDFSLYIRGPYSPELADDYYRIIHEGMDIDRLANSYKPPREAVELLRKLVDIEDIRMLELAATILDIYKAYTRNPVVELTQERLIRHLKIIKPWTKRGQILQALKLLEQLGLIDFV